MSDSLASIDRVVSVWKPVRNYIVYLMTCEPATVSAQQFVFSVEPDNQQCHQLHIIIYDQFAPRNYSNKRA